MSELTTPLIGDLTLNYFQQPRGHCWRWVEEGRVVEWRNGNTICYRAELARVLRGLLEQGWPPLGPVLLVLAACADTWPEASGGVELLKKLLPDLPAAADDPPPAQLERRLVQAICFLDVVRALPAELRAGVPKLHLFREVFSTQAPHTPADQARALLDRWESGQLDTVLHYGGVYLTRRALLHELDCLAQAFERFDTPGQLAQRLRTGLDQLPALLSSVLAAAVPELPAALPEQPVELLAQLAQDQRTASLAQLTQHLLAGLRIPMHTQGASDQPLGGVADITNRGNFDRLLLSELAYDDLALTARLVNHEALYLRREEPPRPQARPHTILLDTTLRLWGTPRVFALAAALAWAQHAHAPRTRAAVTAYALGGKNATPLDLASFVGVVQALSLLDPALHCGAALQAFGRQADSSADHLLITEAHAAQQPDFGQILADMQPALRFLLTVDRAGTLALFEYANGHRTLLSTSRYDLEKLLFAQPRRRPLRVATHPAAPAFLQCVPAPLYFPTLGLRVSTRTTFYQPALGVLGITAGRRVLHWPSKDTGARELLGAIEAGSYHFGSDEVAQLYILVTAPGVLRVYCFDTGRDDAELADLTAELSEPAQEAGVLFRDTCYYVRQAGRTLVFDCRQRMITERRQTSLPLILPAASQPVISLKRYINPGYTTLLRFSHLSVSASGALTLDGRELRLLSRTATHTDELYLLDKTSSEPARPAHAIATTTELEVSEATASVLTRRFTWPDGSEALLDGRGLLHLRSADAAVPEITLLLVLGHATAVWAADGTVCGPDYFTGPNPASRLGAFAFYQRYLQRFTAPLT